VIDASEAGTRRRSIEAVNIDHAQRASFRFPSDEGLEYLAIDSFPQGLKNCYCSHFSFRADFHAINPALVRCDYSQVGREGRIRKVGEYLFYVLVSRRGNDMDCPSRDGNIERLVFDVFRRRCGLQGRAHGKNQRRSQENE